jgi:hypothetical protein
MALFDKGNVVGIKDTVSTGVPEAISLGIRCVTNEGTRDGTME